jgi:hypothetical protein
VAEDAATQGEVLGSGVGAAAVSPLPVGMAGGHLLHLLVAASGVAGAQVGVPNHVGPPCAAAPERPVRALNDAVELLAELL